METKLKVNFFLLILSLFRIIVLKVFKIQDVVALVTGGASGIGKSAAEMIVKNGGKVVIADRSLQGKIVALELGQNASFFQTEVT